MKYCVKCGNSMEDNMTFCQVCGAKSIELGDNTFNQPKQDDYEEYWGLRYYDSFTGRTMELLPQGVHIFSRKGIKAVHWDKIVPYSEIIDLHFEHASMLKKGYLSVITVTEGISSGNSTQQQIKQDNNTVLFNNKNAPLAERVYRALTDIYSAPPALVYDTTDGVYSSSPEKAKKAQQKIIGVGVAICVAFLIGFIALISQITPSTPTNTVPDDLEVICDVNQYANITGEDLIALIGQPDNISNGTCTGEFDIPCTIYDYSAEPTLGEVSFTLVNNSVVRLTSNKAFSYQKGDYILERFGLSKGEHCVLSEDTGLALRYSCPTETVDDFWISVIDTGTDTFNFLQVTYDMQYYEEWYLTMSDDEFYNYRFSTENMVTSLLKSPESAEFPWNNDDWARGKNQYYVIVQSYVDAQNSFGATVRSDFTFIYSTETGELIYAIFDGEVIADNGYVPTADLIS